MTQRSRARILLPPNGESGLWPNGRQHQLAVFWFRERPRTSVGDAAGNDALASQLACNRVAIEIAHADAESCWVSVGCRGITRQLQCVHRSLAVWQGQGDSTYTPNYIASAPKWADATHRGPYPVGGRTADGHRGRRRLLTRGSCSNDRDGRRVQLFRDGRRTNERIDATANAAVSQGDDRMTHPRPPRTLCYVELTNRRHETSLCRLRVAGCGWCTNSGSLRDRCDPSPCGPPVCNPHQQLQGSLTLRSHRRMPGTSCYTMGRHHRPRV